MKGVDILKPASWVRYKPSLCKGCWAGCCTMPVKVDAEDLFHMGFLTAEQVNGPLKKIAARLKRDGVIRSFNAHNRTFTLLQRDNNDCVFLDENRLCTLYERRPAVCRRFPYNSVRPGFCPKQKK